MDKETASPDFRGILDFFFQPTSPNIFSERTLCRESVKGWQSRYADFALPSAPLLS